MKTYEATIQYKSEEEINLLIRRGNLTDQLDDYFAFNALILNNQVELYFDNYVEDVPDPITDKDQYEVLQSIQDDEAFTSALKAATSKALSDSKVMESENNPERFEYWFSFQVGNK